MSRILIVGGYGAFGARVAERLLRAPALQVIIAGRSLDKARAHAAALSKTSGTHVTAAAIDGAQVSTDTLRALAPSLLINASGPFQGEDYTLARACIGAGCHYVDLADARGFVTGIASLDEAAKAADVAVISGASSVPGLSSAAAMKMAEGLSRIETIDIGISPGNSFDPGVATAASIIGAAGKPFRVRRSGQDVEAYGWQGLHRYTFPEIGARWMSDVDVPDVELFPQRYGDLADAQFSAGLEVGLFHLGLWATSWLVRAGLVRDLTPLAGPMLAVKRRLSMLGTDAGGMFVRVAGRDAEGALHRHAWHLIARSGDGPYVPAIASVVLARRLAAGAETWRGAAPCFGLFTLGEFEAEVADLDITCMLERDIPI